MSPPRTPIVLAAGLALLAIALGATLAEAPLTVARTSVRDGSFEVLGIYGKGRRVCQTGETLPAGTSTVRALLSAPAIGPRVEIQATAGGRTITDGARQAGWTGESVTIPVDPVKRGAGGATVCLTTGSDNEAIAMMGERASGPARAVSEGKPLAGRVKVEYLRASGGSWLSHAGSIARRMGFGPTGGDGWIALLLLAGMAIAVVLTSWLVLREADGNR